LFKTDSPLQTEIDDLFNDTDLIDIDRLNYQDAGDATIGDHQQGEWKPFPNKESAVVYSVLFSKARGISIQQIKNVWIIFKALNVKCKIFKKEMNLFCLICIVPKIQEFLDLRNKIPRVYPKEIILQSGVSVNILPMSATIRTLFLEHDFGKDLVRKPTRKENPTSLFETHYFQKTAPLLKVYFNERCFFSGMCEQIYDKIIFFEL
jgi:hypothetical protein